MSLIFPALRAAFRLFFHPRILRVVIGLPVLSLFLWGAVFYFTWTPITGALTAWLGGGWLEQKSLAWFSWSAADIGRGGGFVLALILFFPLSYVTTLVLTSLFVAPLVQSFLLKNEFPGLERRRGGSLSGGVGNTLAAGTLYLLLFALTLPLWLLPGGAVVVPVVLTAWLNRRVLTYDLLQDVASDEERRRLQRDFGGPLFLMCLALAFLSLVPGLGFFLPVWSTLALGWFCDAALARTRRPS
ncbi:MAG: EI24 domain-containing protein [Bdellovibrionaceae bacterium]|nr:EI24 domain-containing protein [Pseudobdellovibrionaceae bacterium]MBX3034202.1 EI24 domain-containing protein [Pseudobdellovibrionaceae bacterium]